MGPYGNNTFKKRGFPYPVKPARSVVAPFDVMLHHLYQLSIEVRVLTEKNEVLLSLVKCVVFVSSVVWVGLYRKADQIMTAAGQLLYFLLIGLRVFI